MGRRVVLLGDTIGQLDNHCYTRSGLPIPRGQLESAQSELEPAHA